MKILTSHLVLKTANVLMVDGKEDEEEEDEEEESRHLS